MRVDERAEDLARGQREARVRIHQVALQSGSGRAPECRSEHGGGGVLPSAGPARPVPGIVTVGPLREDPVDHRPEQCGHHDQGVDGAARVAEPQFHARTVARGPDVHVDQLVVRHDPGAQQELLGLDHAVGGVGPHHGQVRGRPACLEGADRGVAGILAVGPERRGRRERQQGGRVLHHAAGHELRLVAVVDPDGHPETRVRPGAGLVSGGDLRPVRPERDPQGGQRAGGDHPGAEPLCRVLHARAAGADRRPELIEPGVGAAVGHHEGVVPADAHVRVCGGVDDLHRSPHRQQRPQVHHVQLFVHPDRSQCARHTARR